MDTTSLFRKTCRRYNIPRHGHYVTFSCFQRRAFLDRDRTRRWLVDAIASGITKHDFALLAWVCMPEHVHILVYPRRARYDISDLLGAIKIPVSRRAVAFVRKNASSFLPKMLDRQPNGKCDYRFWQRGGGYDRNIHTADELVEKINYIHRNPVRRGLTANATDWEWSSAADYHGIRKGPLEVDVELVRSWVDW